MNHSKSQNPWIAGLSSFAIHLLLLLVLAFWTFAGGGTGGRQWIESGTSSDDAEILETVDIQSTVASSSTGDEQPSETSIQFPDFRSAVQLTEVQVTIQDIPDRLPQAATVMSDVVRLSGSESKSAGASFISSSLSGRSPKNRGELGKLNGASGPSEQAVDDALAYIARHQRNNGSWTMRFEDSPCKGECDHSGIELDPHEIAATGLALLCFMGRGHTMHEGEYSEQVSRGVYFLIQNLSTQSGRATWLTSVAQSEMYEHGIATLAICEALQMNGDAQLLSRPCQETINHIIYAQHNDGGWGYHPKTPGDLSIVGWQVMALKSAASAKLSVNAETIRGVDLFLRQHAKNEFMFFYNDRFNKPTASMTSIGTLMRIYRGWPKTDPAILKSIAYLAKEGPSSSDVYFNYYATQVLFQYGDRPWTEWNKVMRDSLVSSQEKSGHMAGSWWFPVDLASPGSIIPNKTGGRLYMTTMACLTLEVYYRYLPVNESVTRDFQF